jgi:hypothetical protein
MRWVFPDPNDCQWSVPASAFSFSVAALMPPRIGLSELSPHAQECLCLYRSLFTEH